MKEILGEKCYTAEEAAEIVGVTLNNLRNICRRGDMRSFRIGRAMYIKESAIREYTDGTNEPIRKGKYSNRTSLS